MTGMFLDILYKHLTIICTFLLSKLPVGSSHKSTFGDFIMALTIQSLCFSPVDKNFTFVVVKEDKPNSSSNESISSFGKEFFLNKIRFSNTVNSSNNLKS